MPVWEKQMLGLANSVLYEIEAVDKHSNFDLVAHSDQIEVIPFHSFPRPYSPLFSSMASIPIDISSFTDIPNFRLAF